MKVRLEEVNKTVEKYEGIQTQAEDIGEWPDVQDVEWVSFQEECHEIRALMLDIIDEYDKPNLDNGRFSTSHSSMSRDGGFVKLPSVPAPTFDGSL